MTVAVLALALLSGTLQGTSPPTAPGKPRLICREDQQLTGSHIREGRRCKTADQWLLEDQDLDRIPPTMRITKGQEDGRPVEHPP
jgi:hypothetical protein